MTLTRPHRIPAAALALAICATGGASAAEWRIATVNGTVAQAEGLIDFAADGAFGGNTGCNNLRGKARFADGLLIIDGPVATTRMACPDPIMQQEDAILRILAGEVTVAFDPLTDQLTLSRENDTVTLVPPGAEAGMPKAEDTADAPPPPPRPAEDAVPTIFDTAYLNVFGLSGPLNMRQEPGTASKVVAKVLSGTMLQNLGCEDRPDRTWCRVRMLGASGTEGWVAGDYVEPASASLRAGQGVFDAIGTLSCAFAQGDALQDCDYGLARDGAHSVVVVVFRPDGGKRVLFFADGGFAYADTSEADGPAAASGTLADDRFVVTLGSERYEIAREAVFPG